MQSFHRRLVKCVSCDLWLGICYDLREQTRGKDPTKGWKLSPMDLESVNRWDDYSKAKDILGWEAKKNISEMCRDGWNWQLNNPNGY